jgi:hypothetical protein
VSESIGAPLMLEWIEHAARPRLQSGVVQRSRASVGVLPGQRCETVEASGCACAAARAFRVEGVRDLAACPELEAVDVAERA